MKTIKLLIAFAMLAAIAAPAQPPGGGPGMGQPGTNTGMGGMGGGQPGGAGGRGGGGRGGRGARGPSIQQGATGRISPHETISANIGGRVISITYGRPYSKAPTTAEIRKIWGTLVPWNAAWRLGADEATLLLTPVDLAFGSVTIPAGSYTLYMMPVETGASQLVFSKNVGKWGIPVDTTTDVAKVELKKSTLTPPNEQLLLAFEVAAATPPAAGATPPAAPPTPTVTLKIMWEATQYTADFTLKQ